MFNFIKSMQWFMKKNWWRYVIVIFFGIILTLINLLPATLTGKLATGIEEQTLTQDFLIYQILLPFIGVVAAIYIVAVAKKTFQNRLTTTLYYALQVRYMDNILVQDATFFEKFQCGDLLSRALGDVNTVKFSGGNRLLNIFLESLQVLVTFIAMCFINWKLAICCFVPLSGIFFANFFLRAKVKKNWQIVREKNSEMSNVILESITNVRTIRAFSKEEENYEKNLKYSNVAYAVEKSNLKINVIFQPMFQTITMVSMIICYSLGAYFYSKDQIALASLLQFIFYLNLFQSPLTNIGNLINNFYQSLISAERLNEVYESKSQVVDISSNSLVDVESIEFKNFKFKYLGDQDNAIDGVDIKIKAGTTLGIVGHTGAGKSTIVRQLVRQLPIDLNSIYINGMPIETYNQSRVRQMVSYVPQEHVLFSRSVYENVKLGKKNATDEEIKGAIRLADFEKDIENLADGLNTIVGEYGVTLSGGQKQRLAIARAFLKNSDVLILDDSLSAVDGKTEANIISTLNNYRKNKTNIIIAHRLSAVMMADEIIVMDKGKIIERGNHKALMRNKGWYYEQFMAQQMNDEEAIA